MSKWDNATDKALEELRKRTANRRRACYNCQGPVPANRFKWCSDACRDRHRGK